MKYLKYFEGYSESDVMAFNELLKMNPNSEDNDLYAFLAKDEFIEEKHHRFKKVLGIEKMIRISGDRESMGMLQGLQLRAKYVHDVKFYKIWIPKDLREEVENKGYGEIEPSILDAISDKLRRTKSDITPLTNVSKLRSDMKDMLDQSDKYNM